MGSEDGEIGTQRSRRFKLAWVSASKTSISSRNFHQQRPARTTSLSASGTYDDGAQVGFLPLIY